MYIMIYINICMYLCLYLYQYQNIIDISDIDIKLDYCRLEHFFIFLDYYIYPDLIYLCGVATYFAHFLHASANGLVCLGQFTGLSPMILMGKSMVKPVQIFP